MWMNNTAIWFESEADELTNVASDRKVYEEFLGMLPPRFFQEKKAA